MNCNTEAEYAQKDRLLAFIQAKVSNRQDALDILQDTYVKFEECRQAGRECQYPKAYLYKMAQNAAVDFFKKQQVDCLVQKELVAGVDQTCEIKTDDPTCDIRSCTFQFLENLSPENQQAFIKSDIENVPQKDLANQLGIPFSTLKSRVQRTRLYLRAAFTECFKNR